MSKLDRPMPSVSLAGDTDGTEKDNPNRRKSEVELFKTSEYKHYPAGKDISTLNIACDGK